MQSPLCRHTRRGCAEPHWKRLGSCGRILPLTGSQRVAFRSSLFQQPFNKVGVSAGSRGDEPSDGKHDERLEEAVLGGVEQAVAEPFPYGGKQLGQELGE
jgi:hypothetical protein